MIYRNPVILGLQAFAAGIDATSASSWTPSVARLLPWVWGCGGGETNDGRWMSVVSMPFLRSDATELGGNGLTASFPAVPSGGLSWPLALQKAAAAPLGNLVAHLVSVSADPTPASIGLSDQMLDASSGWAITAL